MIKIVGTASYAHKSNIDELINKRIPQHLQEDFRHFIYIVNSRHIQYDIIKYDKNNITLISSPDWDTANEPIVGICHRFPYDKWVGVDEQSVFSSYTTKSNFRQVYHNKWQFVASDYTGFNIDEAKKRTALWMSIPDIKEKKKYIGNKNYWAKLLAENGIEI